MGDNNMSSNHSIARILISCIVLFAAVAATDPSIDGQEFEETLPTALPDSKFAVGQDMAAAMEEVQDTTKTKSEETSQTRWGQRIAYKGCYKDNTRGRRDLPVRKMPNGKSKAQCKAACRGYKYFGLQWTKECWCGNRYGTQGKATGCKCDANNIGGNKNCIFATGAPSAKSGKNEKSMKFRKKLYAARNCWSEMRMKFHKKRREKYMKFQHKKRYAAY